MEMMNKTLQISVEDVLVALTFSAGSGYDNYIDMETGEVVFFPNDTADDRWDDTCDRSEVEEARFALLPLLSVEEEYELRRRFADSVQDEEVRCKLLDIMRRASAFSRFNSYVNRDRQLQDAWLAFEENVVKERIRGILPESYNVDFC